MNYEKKYKEALERAKEWMAGKYGHCVSDTSQEIAEFIFPELKESEDEKLRKEMLQIAKESEDSFYMVLTPNKRETLIAWFEKKGEQIDIANKEYWRGYREGKKEILDKYAELEKQEEQKSDINYLLSWSKIDEKMLQNLENIVKDYWAKAEKEKNEIKIREASNASYFLKTIQKSPLCWIKCSDGLPNRDGVYLVVTDGLYNEVYDLARYDSVEGWHKASEIIYWMPIPQLSDKTIIGQKSFWSEEDELFLKDAIEFIETGWSDKGKSHLVYWLKSIKNRIIWNSSEKQSEHAKFLNSIQVGDQVTRNEDGELFNLSQLNRVAKPNKQKSVDKVEPKFKVGDWITCPEFPPTPSTVAKVVYIVDDQYDLEYLDGTKEVSAIDKVDSTYYRWTINDAKDGDILITENERPFIFKGFLDKVHSNKPVAYGGIVDNGYFSPCSNNCINRWTDGNVYPATKEQCDLLFKEIHEAGYEWNSDKKKLHKLIKE